MDESLSRYLRSLADPAVPVSLSDVERLLTVYPFFTLPVVSLIQREGASLPVETRRALMSKAMLNAPDSSALAMMTDQSRCDWIGFYPAEEKPAVTTDDAITTFLATYGHSSPDEDELLEKLIFNPSADYSVILSREEEDSLPPVPEPADNSQDALINAFILKNKSPQAAQTPERKEDEQSPVVAPSPADHPVSVPDKSDDSSLSESLAKIYIRRGRYDKAFEIIRNLSLNNPKKSVYFADQLRFLQKLMLNSSFEQQK